MLEFKTNLDSLRQTIINKIDSFNVFKNCCLVLSNVIYRVCLDPYNINTVLIISENSIKKEKVMSLNTSFDINNII